MFRFFPTSHVWDLSVNFSGREIKSVTEREGGVQHASFVNRINTSHYIADWVAKRLVRRKVAQKLTGN